MEELVKGYYVKLLIASFTGYFIGTGVHGIMGGASGPIRVMAGLLGSALLALVLFRRNHGRNKALHSAMARLEQDERLQMIRGLSARMALQVGQASSLFIWLYGVWREDLLVSLMGALLFVVLTATDYLSRGYFSRTY